MILIPRPCSLPRGAAFRPIHNRPLISVTNEFASPAISPSMPLSGRCISRATEDRQGHRRRRSMIARSALLIALLAALAIPLPVQADPVADFYRGKTINLVVGTSAG